MNKYLITLLLMLSTALNAEPEAYYRDLDCGKREGVSEYRNPDGTYTDCLTNEVAIEYDFAHKWYECISQAGHYGIETGNTPLCVLIYKKSSDERYLIRATRFTSEYHRIPIAIQIIRGY